MILADLLDLTAELLGGDGLGWDVGEEGADGPSVGRSDWPGRWEGGFNASTAAAAASVIFSEMVVGWGGDSTSLWEMTVR